DIEVGRRASVAASTANVARGERAQLVAIAPVVLLSMGQGRQEQARHGEQHETSHEAHHPLIDRWRHGLGRGGGTMSTLRSFWSSVAMPALALPCLHCSRAMI